MEVEGDYKRGLHKKFVPKCSKDPLPQAPNRALALSQVVSLAPHLSQSVFCPIFSQNSKFYNSFLCFFEVKRVAEQGTCVTAYTFVRWGAPCQRAYCTPSIFFMCHSIQCWVPRHTASESYFPWLVMMHYFAPLLNYFPFVSLPYKT